MSQEPAQRDSHQVVLDWQERAGMPLLSGSQKQIRWAERLRFNLFHNYAHPRHEFYWFKTAGDWIGWRKEAEYHNPSLVLLFDLNP